MREPRALPGSNKSICHDRAATGPLELLILQATPFCNLDCSYCYLPDRDDQSRMDLSVIEKSVRQVVDSNLVDKEFSVIWHAGEPLVLGTDYYETAFRRISEIAPGNMKVNHSFQTNGVLIDSRWCDFFKQNDLRLGLSIDGPEQFHDLYRKTRNGKGTHQKLTRSIRRLKDNQVDFHVIAVLTDDSIRHPDSLFHYFDSLGVDYLCFNIEEIEGFNKASTILQNNRYSDYVKFLNRFHELRHKHDSKLKVREIDGAVSAVMLWQKAAGAERPGPQENTPFKILNVDVNGNFSTFSPELLGVKNERYGSFVFGNVFNGDILDCLHDSQYQKISTAIRRGVEACRTECNYYELCGGGSPSNKLAEKGCLDCTETEYCRLQKMASIDVALNLLEEELGIVA